MPVCEIVSTTQEHLDYIIPRLRASAIEEFEAIGFDPETVLRKLFEVSRDTFTGLADGEPVCCFGIYSATILSDLGVPWFTGTEEAARHGRIIACMSIPLIKYWKRVYTTLQTSIDGRNLASIRWMKALGMKVGKEPAREINGVSFYLAEWRRK